MIAALLLGFVLFAVSLYFHMWMLRGAKALLEGGSTHQRSDSHALTSLYILWLRERSLQMLQDESDALHRDAISHRMEPFGQ